LLVACAHDPFAPPAGQRGEPPPATRRRCIGLHRDDDWRADSIQLNGAGGSDFLVVKNGETLGLVRTRLPGEHNVLNALAALAVADHAGVSFNDARNALADYRGAGRRFEVMGEGRGVTWVDDYAHHPTEIRATLAAARRRFAATRVGHVPAAHVFAHAHPAGRLCRLVC
jgi:UDP-N-acetylmuramate--alanine ligase